MELSLYAQSGYLEVRELLDAKTSRKLLNWMVTDVKFKQSAADDAQVPHSISFYRPPFELTLLESLIPKINVLTGCKIYPGHIYGRIYLPGSRLKRHVDKKVCELTVSVCVGKQTPESWPLYIELESGEIKKFDFTCGDAVAFDGRRFFHWRETLRAGWQAQLFLHYKLSL